MLALRLPYDQIQLFFLVLLRVAAMLASMPVIGGRGVPMSIKAALALAVSLALLPILSLSPVPVIDHWLNLAIGVGAEILLGTSIGLLIQLLFSSVQIAGQIAGFQMGLAIANIMDPASSMQIPILAQVYNLIAMLLFLTINAHHWFFFSLADSFRIIPPMQFTLAAPLMQHLVETGGAMFVVALKIGAPVIVVLILTSVAFGLVARTVPQMNIFIVAMPLKIVIGLLFAGLSLPYLQQFMTGIFDGFGASLTALLKVMG